MRSSVHTELLSVSHPSIPFFSFVPEGMCIGTAIYLEGLIPQNSNKFDMDIIDGEHNDNQTLKNGDIPIGISVRFDDQSLVRNTRRDGKWGLEEKDGYLPIKKGERFVIVIVVEEDFYIVTINGRQFKYQHRMAMDRGKLFQIRGDVKVHRIEFRHGGHVHRHHHNHDDY